jgi:hypothetical protein
MKNDKTEASQIGSKKLDSIVVEHFLLLRLIKFYTIFNRSHGVVASTLDFESSDPSSNLGGT